MRSVLGSLYCRAIRSFGTSGRYCRCMFCCPNIQLGTVLFQAQNSMEVHSREVKVVTCSNAGSGVMEWDESRDGRELKVLESD
jgi:hypothetical protein